MFYLLTLLLKISTNHTKTRWQQAEKLTQIENMNNINFKKWAFHFMIWIIIINIISFYLTISYNSLFNGQDNTGEVLLYFGIIGIILLLLSLVFIILSSIKNEKKNYQYWISVIGVFIFGVLPILASLF